MITTLNIDDFIRAAKQLGYDFGFTKTTIEWDKKGYEVLRKFTQGNIYLGATHQEGEHMKVLWYN